MNTKGIGLGLVISDKIVNEFNGTLTFTSVPDKGSQFTYTFALNSSDEYDKLHNNNDSNEF